MRLIYHTNDTTSFVFETVYDIFNRYIKT